MEHCSVASCSNLSHRASTESLVGVAKEAHEQARFDTSANPRETCRHNRRIGILDVGDLQSRRHPIAVPHIDRCIERGSRTPRGHANSPERVTTCHRE
jgi:hypothetical protein